MKTLLILISIIINCCTSVFSQTTANLIEQHMADSEYQKVIDIIEQSKNKDLYLKQIAFCNFSLMQYSKAIEAYKLFINIHPKDIQARLQLAQCYEASSLLDESNGCYDELLSMDSTNNYFRIRKADLNFQFSKYNDALAIYKSLTTKDDSPSISKRIAQCFERTNQLDSARFYYQKTFDKDPLDRFAVTSLINICLKQEDYSSALDISENYIQKDSINKQINLLNGLSYYGLNRYDEAVERFYRCNRMDNDTSLILNRSLGVALYYVGDSENAYSYLKNAFRQDTTNNNVLYALATTSKDLRHTSEAITYFDKLLSRTIPPKFQLFVYYKGLATSYEQIQNYSEAINNYKYALENSGFSQSIEMLYKLANLCEIGLDNVEVAAYYYKKYKESLIRYSEQIEAKEEKDPEEIKRIEALFERANRKIKDMNALLELKTEKSSL